MKNLLAVLVLFSSSLLLLHAGDNAKDVDRLQGTWTVASLTEEGKAVPANELAQPMPLGVV